MHPGKETRQQRRQRERDQAKARRAEEQRSALQAQQHAQMQQQIGDLGTYIKGFENGFLTGYSKALEDLKGGNVVEMVATQILAVGHDPKQQAEYVLDKFQKAMRPRTPEALQQGLQRAVTDHLTDIGVMPAMPQPEAEQEPEPIVVDEEGRTESGLIIPGAAA